MIRRDQRNLGLEGGPCVARRAMLGGLAATGGAALLGLPAAALSRRGAEAPGAGLAAHTQDWDWLTGSWDVFHRRLRERLAGSTQWEEFGGKSAFWHLMDGLGNVDDNVIDLPSGVYRGVSIRAFDPDTGSWSIWWLDGRSSARLEPPVTGSFANNEGIFFGRDVHQGQPVTVRFHWKDLGGPRPNWEQAFSVDEGRTWEVNWVNFFTRTAPEPIPLPRLADAPTDWDFLVGSWDVRHRRLARGNAGDDRWETFGGTLVNRPLLGGHGNVSDNVIALPAGTYRGIGVRTFDPDARTWSSWWLDGRTPTEIAPALRGAFADGVGTFVGDEVRDGRPGMTRVRWSRITPATARWEQAHSTDGGTTWETNWISDFARQS